MDNASKALIMAGAILIAIALVGVGVYLFQMANSTIDGSMDELAAASVQTKNAQIEDYEGEITGSELKTLIRRMKALNASKIFPTDLQFNGSNVTSSTSTSGINNSTKYTVTVNYGTDGYVSGITTSPKPSGS